MQTESEDPQEETTEEETTEEETTEEETPVVEVENTPPPPDPWQLMNQRLDGIEKLIKNANKKPTQKKEETPANGKTQESKTGPTEPEPTTATTPTEPTRRRGLRLKKRS